MLQHDMSQYIHIFMDELEEQLQVLEDAILRLESNPQEASTIQNIFRAAHTIKGSSASMGINPIKELTHGMENVFDAIRNGKLAVTTEMIGVIFESIDALKQMKVALGQGKLVEEEIHPLLDKLDAIQHPEKRTASSKLAKVQTSVETLDLTADSHVLKAAKAAVKMGLQVLEVKVGLAPTTLMKAVRAYQIYHALEEMGEIIKTYPSAQEMEDEQLIGDRELLFLLLTEQKTELVVDKVNHISEVRSVHILSRTEEIHTETAPVVAQKERVQQTIRVDVDRLERLLDTVGELVIAQTRLMEVRNRLVSEDLDTQDMLSDVTNQFSYIISSLQEGMMKTRLLPIEQLFNRFPRMIRDTALKAGKEVDLVIEGKETELDRHIIEEIGDPLIHLLRNAVDHGIESPDDRRQVGKPVKGRILLKAEHRENNIVITIRDDGKGIDPKKLKESALKKQLITTEEAERLSDREAIQLIFRPGFSTAKEISDISGRGVGMDIVKSHIQNLNGTIDIHSEVGQGTTFTLSLPLTLAIIRSLLVRIGQQLFAIPASSVSEIVTIKADEIQELNNHFITALRGQIIPVIPIKRRIAPPNEGDRDKPGRFMVIINIGGKRAGILVDETIGNQEVVIKSLGSFIGSPPFFSGATVLGDGRIALILDITSIMTAYEIPETDQWREEISKSAATEEMKIAVLRQDEKEWGIPIEYVQSIMPLPRIQQLQSAHPAVRGLAEVRDQIIPVVSLGYILGRETLHSGVRETLCVLDWKGKQVGLIVEQVSEVLKCMKQQIKPVSEMTDFIRYAHVKSVYHDEERVVLLPDLNEILNEIALASAV